MSYIRVLAGSIAIALLPLAAFGQKAQPPILQFVDHIIYATPNVDSTVAELESRLGVLAAPGGRQPNRGTKNALISLGPRTYLEIVGPDSSSSPVSPPWWLKSLRSPRIVAWAAAGSGLEQLRAEAVTNGVPLGEVMAGSRERPDGVVLRWHFTSPRSPLGDGVVPFFIDWGDTPHPATTSPQGISLVAFEGEHPDPMSVRQMLRILNLELPVRRGDRPALTAWIKGSYGVVELR